MFGSLTEAAATLARRSSLAISSAVFSVIGGLVECILAKWIWRIKRFGVKWFFGNMVEENKIANLLEKVTQVPPEIRKLKRREAEDEIQKLRNEARNYLEEPIGKFCESRLGSRAGYDLRIPTVEQVMQDPDENYASYVIRWPQGARSSFDHRLVVGLISDRTIYAATENGVVETGERIVVGQKGWEDEFKKILGLAVSAVNFPKRLEPAR